MCATKNATMSIAIMIILVAWIAMAHAILMRIIKIAHAIMHGYLMMINGVTIIAGIIFHATQIIICVTIAMAIASFCMIY